MAWRCSGGPPELAWFLVECHAQRLPYKLTGGLHHAVRTRDEHGILNVLAAAFFGDEEDALAEPDPASFQLDREGFGWRERRASTHRRHGRPGGGIAQRLGAAHRG